MVQTVLVIGGTGAQGSEIVRTLSKSGSYAIKVLTRSAKSASAKELSDLPNVTLIEGDSYDVADLSSAFKGVELCYVNTNGFALGEKAEIYWGIRIFELAREAGLKHYVWAGLPYIYKKSGYNPKYQCGHLDGKGRVSEFITAQPTTPMAWTIINSCYYLEMFYEASAAPKLDNPPPSSSSDNPNPHLTQTYIFTSPVGNGGMPMIHLADLAAYTEWAFSHPSLSTGLTLDTATEHVRFENVAQAFTEVTGRPARYQSVPVDLAMQNFAKTLPEGEETRIGGPATARGGDPTLVRFVDNFTAFYEIHRAAEGEGNQGFWNVDYEKLDRILPNRVRSVGDWMKKVGYTGEPKSVIRRFNTD